MMMLITEYLGALFGAVLLGGLFFSWIVSGVILKAIFGLIFLLIIAGFLFVITKRTIQYCIDDYKIKKKGDPYIH